METIGGRDVATDVRAVPISVRVSFHNSLGKVTIQCLAFFPSVCLRVGSIATCRIVSFRGEGFSDFFVPTSMLFVVQFGPQHTNTLWVVLCQRTAFVMSSLVS